MSDKYGIQPVEIIRVNHGKREVVVDAVSVEEPIEIRIAPRSINNEIIAASDSVTDSASKPIHPTNISPATSDGSKALSITMRTPGNDQELAAGFLFTEGLISDKTDIISWHESPQGETLTAVLRNFDGINPASLERHFYTTSSCGVCGKSSIDAVRTSCKIALPPEQLSIESAVLLQLPQRLREKQSSFEHTGGIHACALFTDKGELAVLREDVGRHNALDKLIGTCLLGLGENSMGVPLTQFVLLLSGRASFELVQKAAMAGIRLIAAVGAPSSLAIELADELGITLVGFLRESRFNIYTHPHRIQ